MSGAAVERVSPLRALVIIPTYNERENILGLLERILALPLSLRVMVVDDNSPDGTGPLVADYSRRDPRVTLLSRPAKMGLGSAYRAGFKQAIQQDVDLVFEMDADFSHFPDALLEFVKAIEGADVVVGSRYIRGVTVVHWPLRRLILSYGANVYTRVITGLPLRDATGGFKCFRREVLAAINLDRVRSDGYAFQIEMNYKCWRKGFRLREIPITFVDRRAGVSKMNRKIIWEAVWMVWRLRLLDLLGQL
ncbi:MAG TPA: polyprenol monophosphomannose synthase [Candidatus Saccharimonadales bacterium]|nr:polyprenol monophosphomannose synthase [Candidatus Saccharimonadales bacterium]